MKSSEKTKTTIELNKKLIYLAKMKALEENKTLREILEEGLHLRLQLSRTTLPKKNISTLKNLRITGGPKDLSKKLNSYLFHEKNST